MQVIIRDRGVYEYKPDFDDGWKFSRGDYFKFPVAIGPAKCFIKRFDRTPESIPGWALLEKLKGKHEPNLPRIHDIVETEEDGKNVNYVFHEFIEGETLHNLISRRIEVNLENLTDNLFEALQAIHKRGFWFADFCEKNIFRNSNKQFLLIDLDSVQPVSEGPNNEMGGSKEYWATVFDFCIKILNHGELMPSHFNGASFNYLHVIFLVLHLRIFYYTETDLEFTELLAEYLNKISPSFKMIFEKVFQNEKKPLEFEDITVIKSLIKEKIIALSDEKLRKIVEGIDSPVINEFTLSHYIEKADDRYVIGSGEIFKLKWNIQNASHIELYKNGKPFKKFDINDTSIELKGEDAGGMVEYTIRASNGGEIEKRSLTIKSIFPDPVVNEFILTNYIEKNGDNYIIENGKPVNLKWDVQNAMHIRLYRNGEVYRKFNKGETSIELEETSADNKRQEIEYMLIATNNDETSAQKSLTVKISYQKPVINKFVADGYVEITGDEYVIDSGKVFQLRWDVQNALNIELHKNGKPFKKFNKEGKNIEIREQLHDRNLQKIEYTLIAWGNDESIEKKSLTIRLIYLSPVIEFAVSDYIEKKDNEYVVEHKKTFKLKCFVQNVLDASLYRNGALYNKKINPGETNIDIAEETHDGKPKKIEYSLIVSNSDGSTARKSLIIRVIYPEPVINDFKANKYAVRIDKPFKLLWDVQNASLIRLYRNRELYQSLSVNENSIELTEKVYEDNETEIEYFLTASNGFVEIKSDPAIITLKPKPSPIIGSPLFKKVMMAISGLILLSLILYFVLRPGPVQVDPFRQEQIAESDTIAISGKNLPEDRGTIHVKFGDLEGDLIRQTKESLLVQVPKIIAESGYVAIHVSVDGNPYKVADHVLYTVKPELPPITKLPSSLNEIWHDNANRMMVNINLLKDSIYYSSGDINHYVVFSIGSVTHDNAGTYMITATSKQGNKFFSIKNVEPRSFELSVCDSPKRDCSEFTAMGLYYENSPLQIYLPVTTNQEIREMEAFEKIKLNKIKNAGDTVKVFFINKYVELPGINKIMSYLSAANRSYAITPLNMPGTNPFKRNYFTISGQIKAPVSNQIKDTKETAGNKEEKPAPPVPPSPAKDEIDLGYVLFDDRHDPVNTVYLEKLAQYLSENPQAKIKFYADWENEDERNIAAENVIHLKNYLNQMGLIGLSSNQVDIKASRTSQADKNLHKLYIRGVNFPADFEP